MYYGVVKKKRCVPAWVANKQGFASLYTLLILQFVMAFVAMLISSSKTVIANKQIDDNYHRLQLYAIYHAKMYIQQEDMKDDEAQNENTFSQQEENLSYLDQEINILYNSNYIDITIAHIQMRLKIDEITKNIINFEYL